MADLSLATIHYKLARDQKLCEFEIDQLSHYKAAPATSAQFANFRPKLGYLVYGKQAKRFGPKFGPAKPTD
jgi:hypothetical protein